MTTYQARSARRLSFFGSARSDLEKEPLGEEASGLQEKEKRLDNIE